MTFFQRRLCYAVAKGAKAIKTVIYLDVLLLVNFVLGALFLLAAGLLGGQRCAGGRLLCGAGVAAASSLALLPPLAPWPLALLYKGATGALCVLAAYGWPGVRGFVKLLAWFWLMNLLLTGAVLLPGAGVQANNLSIYLPLSPGVLLICAGIVYGAVQLILHTLGGQSAACFDAVLELDGAFLHLRAFHDTGFLAQEPLSGRAVALVRYPAVKASLPPALSTYLDTVFSNASTLPPPEWGVRFVPCDTVAGHCLLPAVPAKTLSWQENGHTQTWQGLYAAFCDTPPPPNGWEMLVGEI